MRSLQDVEKIIYEMRQELHVIIDKKGSLIDEEVVAASQNLDMILNEYNVLLGKRCNYIV